MKIVEDKVLQKMAFIIDHKREKRFWKIRRGTVRKFSCLGAGGVSGIVFGEVKKKMKEKRICHKVVK